MEARMQNPALVVPDAMPALLAVGKIINGGIVPAKILNLVYLRASQINGCALCIDMHSRAAKKGGDTDERLLAVSAWQETPYFTDAERAALALTEASTRLNDRSTPVPDDVWKEAARHFDTTQLGVLVLGIGAVNMWNRINVTTRQLAGSLSK